LDASFHEIDQDTYHLRAHLLQGLIDSGQ